jgi:transposase-like protein
MGRIKGKYSPKAKLAILALARGDSVATVARELRVSERTVYRWKKAFRTPAVESVDVHAPR